MSNNIGTAVVRVYPQWYVKPHGRKKKKKRRSAYIRVISKILRVLYLVFWCAKRELAGKFLKARRKDRTCFEFSFVIHRGTFEHFHFFSSMNFYDDIALKNFMIIRSFLLN